MLDNYYVVYDIVYYISYRLNNFPCSIYTSVLLE